MVLKSVMLSLLALGVGGVVWAEGDEEAKDKKLDPAKVFAKADADGDKKVTKEEFKKFLEGMPKGGDKLAARADQMFERLDTNKDDSLSEEEFGKLRENIGGGAGKGKLDPEKLKELKEKFGGKIDQEKIKEIMEKFGGKIDQEKMQKLLEKLKNFKKDEE